MILTDDDLGALAAWRKALHRARAFGPGRGDGA